MIYKGTKTTFEIFYKQTTLVFNVKDFMFYKYICEIVYFGRYKIKF